VRVLNLSLILKVRREILPFTSTNYNFLFIVHLNQKITLAELQEIFKNSGFTIATIKTDSLSVLEITIEGQKFYLYPKNNYIIGGFKENLLEFIKKNIETISSPSYKPITGNNTDILLNLNIPQTDKNEFNPKNQLSLGIYGIDTNILKNINNLKAKINFNDHKALCSVSIFTNDNKSSESFFLLLKQYLPILKYKLLTTDHGKLSSFADSIKFKKLNDNKIKLDFSFTVPELYFIINSK